MVRRNTLKVIKTGLNQENLTDPRYRKERRQSSIEHEGHQVQNNDPEPSHDNYSKSCENI